MAYTRQEGQQQLLDSLAPATQEIETALGALGEAHEQLDEQSGERLEEQMFRPVQRAYALARRTRVDFASRNGMANGALATPTRGAPARGPKGFLEDATESVQRADTTLAELQDSMLPVEVGDAELRSGMSAVRELLGQVPPAAREMLRTFGR
jgi:hypothetical protein